MDLLVECKLFEGLPWLLPGRKPVEPLNTSPNTLLFCLSLMQYSTAITESFLLQFLIVWCQPCVTAFCTITSRNGIIFRFYMSVYTFFCRIITVKNIITVKKKVYLG